MSMWLEVQKMLIEMTLTQTLGNKVQAAKILGISIRTLRNKLRDFKMNQWADKRSRWAA